VSDAVAVIVSEEAGSISISHAGRMIRNIDAERLENILNAFYRPTLPSKNWIERSFPYLFKEGE
jgi:diadenylate cyclase